LRILHNGMKETQTMAQIDLDKDELEPLLKRIRWRKAQLADALGCSEKTIRQMIAGERQIPRAVAIYLRRLDRIHEKYPPPRADVWRIRPDLAPESERPPPERKAAA
jgi:hypothetical protein